MVEFILVGLFIILIWYYYVTPLSYWEKKGVKQLKPWIFFGDLWTTTLGILSLTEFVGKIYNIYPNLRYFGIYQFSTPILVLRDSELIKQITVRDFDHFTDHNNFIIDTQTNPLWGGNLFALEGKRWREMRATLSRVFTSSKIKCMFLLMEEAADNFIKFLSNNNEDLLELDIKNTFARYSNDVIATTAFGIKVDSLNDPQNIFYRMGTEITNLSGFVTNLKILGHFIMPNVLRTLNIGVLSRTISNYFSSIIIETIKTREEKGIVRSDMINLLIEARKTVNFEETGENDSINESSDIGNFKQLRYITNDDIASQAFVFFFGGFDTVSSALCFGAYELTFNKTVQDKLRQEIRKTYRENNGKITYDVLLQMKYLDMVVSEVLRKWPLVSQLDRICTKPYTIEAVNSGEMPVQLKVGDVVWIPVSGIHKDPAYYVEPEKFDPERFSDENQNKINPYTYMPFGIGPRNCIGSRFALIELKVLLFHLLLNFEIVPAKKTVHPLKLTKKSLIPTVGDLWLGLKRIRN